MDKERIGSTKELTEEERLAIIESSSRKLGRAVFYSILVTLISFAPVFFLEGQERKLFTPLVLTKTLAMIGSIIVALFVVPVAMRSLMKGKLVPESRNVVSRFFIRIYSPVLHSCLKWKKTVLGIALLILLGSIPLVINVGTEFMPPLDEGSLLMMPVTLPDVSNTEAKRILQIQDKILKSFPEVKVVLGKAGRANTATDNAPISMIETFIILKPKSEWREGMTTEKLIAEMDEKVRIPGVTVGWTQPIINRINMLSTGIRTDVGIKIYGQDIDSIYSIGLEVEKVLKGIPGLADLYAEQLTGGKYLDVRIRKDEIGRYGLSIDDVNMVVEAAIGGMNFTSTVDGRRRFPIGVRLGQDYRFDIESMKRLPVQTPSYGIIPLSAVADFEISDGPPMINSENAMLRGTVLFNVRGRDMGSVVKDAKEKIDSLVQHLPEGYTVEWSGQYENQVRAEKRLKVIIPIVLLIIGFVLYITFRSFKNVLIVFISIPVALVGGVYSLYYYDINFSVAVAVGFIALFGIAVETGVLMIVYMNDSIGRLIEKSKSDAAKINVADVNQAVHDGAVLRVRPKLMTVMADMIGLLPILFSAGTGSDVMKPIAIPFVFGLITSTFFVLIVLPVIYELVKEYELKKHGQPLVSDINE